VVLELASVETNELSLPNLGPCLLSLEVLVDSGQLSLHLSESLDLVGIGVLLGALKVVLHLLDPDSILYFKSLDRGLLVHLLS